MEEKELQESLNIQTETVTSVNEETKQTLDSLPRLEELRKSEQDVKVNTEIHGVSQVERKTQVKDRVFTRRVDEKKVYLKKRLNILKTVYTTVVTLLFAFVITNVVTFAVLNGKINGTTNTIIAAEQQISDEEKNSVLGENLGEIQISLNEPRDYSEDKKELTWLDKMTILFRNLFS